MNDQRTYLKVKLKSLAAEAKIIRAEEKKAKKYRDRKLLSGLESHRKDVVRSAARHTLLAYAFIRGVPYKKVEAKCEKAPDLKRIMVMVQKYGSMSWKISHFNPDNKDANTWHSSTRKAYEEERARLSDWLGIAPPEEKGPPAEKKGLVSRIFG